jgi:hypothetical protein
MHALGTNFINALLMDSSKHSTVVLFTKSRNIHLVDFFGTCLHTIMFDFRIWTA